MGAGHHDRCAPFWAAALVVLCAIGVFSTFVDGGPFWNGYVLDMTGPAWSYILFRGLFTAEASNLWTRTFTPFRTLAVGLAACLGIETVQYFEFYDSTYDPWDFLAYVSLLVPVFLVDLWQSSREPEAPRRADPTA